jgi:hypothetical protein
MKRLPMNPAAELAFATARNKKTAPRAETGSRPIVLKTTRGKTTRDVARNWLSHNHRRLARFVARHMRRSGGG